MYASLGIVGFVSGCGLYLCFRNSFDDVPVIAGQEAANIELDVAGVAEHGGKLAVEEDRWRK
jgi:POT family proton-dependent oligopeptide transporter